MTTIILLRLVHILTGVTWVGAMVFNTFFLFPALRGDPATTGKVMQGLMQRRFMQIMPAFAILTIASGLWLLSVMGGADMGAYMRSNAGRIFSMSGGLAILGFVFGLLVGRPTAMKAGALGAQMATVTDPAAKAKLQEEMAALQKRSVVISLFVTTLLLVAVAGMAVARYV